MKYAIVNATKKTVRTHDFNTIEEAMEFAGLKPGEVDIGSMMRGYGIVVYEFGLYQPPSQTKYFTINRRLFAGNAVVFKIDAAGETVSLDGKFPTDVRFFEDETEVMQAIQDEEVIQPSLSVGDHLVWVWPQPAPAGIMGGAKEEVGEPNAKD